MYHSSPPISAAGSNHVEIYCFPGLVPGIGVGAAPRTGTVAAGFAGSNPGTPGSGGRTIGGIAAAWRRSLSIMTGGLGGGIPGIPGIEAGGGGGAWRETNSTSFCTGGFGGSGSGGGGGGS